MRVSGGGNEDEVRGAENAPFEGARMIAESDVGRERKEPSP
jgi:hypothetical protein